MAVKQEYITIGLPKSTLTILKKFVDFKGLTTKEAFSEIAEAYMIAKDFDLFKNLLHEYYGIEKIQIELAKQNMNMIKEDNTMKAFNKEMIACKLADVTSTVEVAGRLKVFNGRKTMKIYINHINKSGLGYTYFSTNILHSGMNKNRLKDFTERIDSGEIIKIFFIINDESTKNDIAYSADILDIISNKIPVSAPCRDDEYPSEFHGQQANIWIKLSNLREETTEKASDYIISNKGTILKESISSGRCAFMYVKKKTV